MKLKLPGDVFRFLDFSPLSPRPEPAEAPEVAAEQAEHLQKAEHDQQSDNGNDDAPDTGVHRYDEQSDANDNEQH
jgi:hypothetical protein